MNNYNHMLNISSRASTHGSPPISELMLSNSSGADSAGDRRFSPWKGSVVDPVVGVFLTRNVSDHLSSSAFMSLASHFPLKSEREYESCSEEKGSSQIRVPIVSSISHPEEIVTWTLEMSNTIICDESSMNPRGVELDEYIGVLNITVHAVEEYSGQLAPQNKYAAESAGQLTFENKETKECSTSISQPFQ